LCQATRAFPINRQPKLHRRTKTDVSAIEKQTDNTDDTNTGDRADNPQGNSSASRHSRDLLSKEIGFDEDAPLERITLNSFPSSGLEDVDHSLTIQRSFNECFINSAANQQPRLKPELKFLSGSVDQPS